MPYNFKEIKKRLLKLGYKVNRQIGSHVIFTKPSCSPIPVPKHAGKDISIGVEMEILKKVQLNKIEFKNLK